MKILLALLLALTGFQATANETLLSCENATIVTDWDEETETPSFETVFMGLTVTNDSNTKYGFRADFVDENNKAVEVLDTNYEVEPFSEEDNDLIVGLVQMLHPDLDVSKIKSIGIANIGVEANQDDQNGLNLMNLFSESGELLGKVGLFGWAFGKCD